MEGSYARFFNLVTLLFALPTGGFSIWPALAQA
jgi:hypothetical protein